MRLLYPGADLPSITSAQSRDEFFQLALDAFAREMEANARAVAISKGMSDVDALRLDELVDVLGALDRGDSGNRPH
jgi:hypothetical protein